MLTTEQKINMLILAGFEPRRFIGGGPRLCGPLCHLSRALGSAYWTLHSGDARGTYKTKADWDWEDMRLDICPDKLIYQAIETTG